jgi:predicted SnoaL-like aldol condensation-catalyzing enzyme
VQSEPALPPTLLVAEGDIVVMAASLPQPEPDDSSKRYPYFLYNAYRLRNGKIAEHWGGVNKAAPPAPPEQ